MNYSSWFFLCCFFHESHIKCYGTRLLLETSEPKSHDRRRRRKERTSVFTQEPSTEKKTLWSNLTQQKKPSLEWQTGLRTVKNRGRWWLYLDTFKIKCFHL